MAVAALWVGTVANAGADALSAYLAKRKEFGITRAAEVAALEAFVGKRTVEIQGNVTGTFRVGDRQLLLLERTDGQSLHIDTDVVPEWLHGNSVAARLLVKAERPQENAPLQARLIAAALETDIAAFEAAEARRAAAAAARRPASPPTPSRQPNRGGTSARNWNLPHDQVIPYYARFIRERNPRLAERQALDIAEGIVGFSIRYGVDARLILAMVMTESGFRPDATSRAGAMGLGQLMPGTARGLGITDAYDTFQNLWGTVRVIRGHIDRYGRQVGHNTYDALVLALAAYNAGSGNVRRHGGVPPFRETQNYIQRVIGLYRALVGES